MEKEHNIQYWNVKSSGGHFAPMEEPEVLIDEIRKFFNPHRKLI
jgi:microsomal epoxide hydrolase